MLVFISDLHFVDGSAGDHNVPVDAFRAFFQHLAAITKRQAAKGRKIEKIKIVFLGDIFDLLRTTYWLNPLIKESERPWGSNENRIRYHAEKIFDSITQQNQSTFDLFSDNLKTEFDLPTEPEKIYVPGNHDRLCNKYPSLRKKVCTALGIAEQDDPFDHNFMDVAHGVFARHGHEYDKFNYEGSTSYTDRDYMRVPIGDPITTELIAKLPWKIINNPKVKNLRKAQREALERNFQEIDNVRPFSAILQWLLYQVKQYLWLKEVIEDAIDETISEFNKLRFVKRWYDHHDKWTDFMDEADKIQSVLFLLEHFKIFPMEKFLPLLDKVISRFAKDDLRAAVPAEYSALDSRIRYVVYGHSHDPLQVPVRVTKDPLEPKAHVYMNTGTWRARFHKCEEGLDFIGWKNMTYIVFYKPGERTTDFPAFETWTGTLKTS